MSMGRDLTAAQVRGAISYNEHRHRGREREFCRHFGVAESPSYTEELVRAVADWQEANIARGQGDGKIGKKTEAHLNLQHPDAAKAAEEALDIQSAGGVLFDSWSNDLRDNDNDGVCDGSRERRGDGSHFGRSFTEFRVIAGTYRNLGWNSDRTVTVPRDRTVRGVFRYQVCADVVSKAYHRAGVMDTHRSTRQILNEFHRKGFVWRRSEGYPTKFMPGDFICTLSSHGGHSGIVTEESDVADGAPTVVELPGPSTRVDLGSYDPVSTNDIWHGSWTKHGLVPEDRFNYVARLVQGEFVARH